MHVALQLFSERGYDGTSIDDIRQAVGFKSKASLYTHFRSKEEVAEALLAQILRAEEETVGRAFLRASEEPLQRLAAVGRAFIGWGMASPREYAFCFLRIQQQLSAQTAEGRPIDQPDASTLAMLKLLSDVRTAGYPVRPIPDAALLTMMTGLISRSIVDQTAFGPVSLETKVEQVLEACFGIFFTQPLPVPK
jgi:AcrR family transcriptional regulator